MTVDLLALANEEIVLWSRGNRPTQVAFSISEPSALLHLRALCLLADRVLAAGSYYFESMITRAAVDALRPLLEDDKMLFFVSEEYETFTEHGLDKIDKSPTTLRAYADIGVVVERGATLDRRATLLRRPGVGLSEAIVALWSTDLLSDSPGSLGDLVRGEADPASAMAALANAPNERQGDFVWEAIESSLNRVGCSPRLRLGARRRLAQLWAEATATMLGAHVDSPHFATGRSHLAADSQYDTELFLACLRSIGLVAPLEMCTAEELLTIRSSAGWIVFHSFYRDLVLRLAGRPSEAARVLPIIREAVRIRDDPSRSSLTRREFVRVLTRMLRIASRRRPPRAAYRRLADRFAAIMETFGADPLRLLDESLAIGAGQPIVALATPIARGAPMRPLRCFLVHGHDSGLLLELKDFLQNAIGWPEPVILAQQPSRGLTVIEKFEEYAKSVDVVCVLMTPDDEAGGAGKRRARQNVLFELGFFVSYFGRKSGRVLLLVSGEVDIPSDLAGVVYIDVSNGIAAAGETIRREVAGIGPRGGSSVTT